MQTTLMRGRCRWREAVKNTGEGKEWKSLGTWKEMIGRKNKGDRARLIRCETDVETRIRLVRSSTREKEGTQSKIPWKNTFNTNKIKLK